MPDLLDRLTDLPPAMLLAIPALLIIAEAALLFGVVLPGASAVLALGMLAHAGQSHPVLAAAVAAVAAVAGTQLAYLRGRRSGLPTPTRLEPQRQRAIRPAPSAPPATTTVPQYAPPGRPQRSRQHAGHTAPTAAEVAGTTRHGGTGSVRALLPVCGWAHRPVWAPRKAWAVQPGVGYEHPWIS